MDEAPVTFFATASGSLVRGDAVTWLRSLPDGSVNLIVADPPYNIAKAEWDTFESQEAYVAWSMEWIAEAARVLTSVGTLYVCGFSEILADLRLPSARYFAACRWLVWHYRNKANLRDDWGRSHESILHLRKSRAGFTFHTDDVRIPYGAHTLRYPDHPQAETSQYGSGKEREHWVPNPRGAKPRDVFEIPTTSNGMAEKTPHPTQKPEELIRRLVLASSSVGDLVVDPFVGSGTTCVVAEQTGRRWAGCDLDEEYLAWARRRIEGVERRSVAEWIAYDRANEQRRHSIR